jgi:ubiquinone/menaquinone biosynthesis C-methylase UbiE
MAAKNTNLQKESVREAYRKWAPGIQIHHEDAFHVMTQAFTEMTLRTYVLPLPKNTPILDLGGGDGQWSLYLAKNGFTHIALADISPELLEIARKQAEQANITGNINFQEVDIENMRISSRYPLVLCLGGVLSHCLNYKQALQNIYDVLDDNGVGIISVDSFYEAKITAQFIEDTKELEELMTKGISRQFFQSRLPYYSKYFHYSELAETLIECGFRILRAQSRPQITGWDLKARFKNREDFQKTLDKEIRLAEQKELMDYGYQLEFVVTK